MFARNFAPPKFSLQFLVVFVAQLVFVTPAQSWGGHEKVLLSDVRTLTLHNGQMTTARRSSPVPQLQCVGGSAGCYKFTPQVVQCTNKGSDGYDIQWECKADMDNKYRFGRIEVSCEGFDHPNDQYVLKGSCGLEYTIDSTGRDGSGYSSYGQDYSSKLYKKTSGLGDLLLLAVVGLIIYGVYRTCISNRAHDDTQRPYPEPSAPPPPGFRPEYTSGMGMGSSYNSGCDTNSANTNNAGGGFWTGAGLGSLAGYFLGSRNRGYPGSTYTDYGYHSPGYRSRSSWGNNNSGWGSFGSGGGSSSSGTRTASGFGGTKRR